MLSGLSGRFGINATAIKSTGVIFTPGEKIREMLNNTKFQKM